MTAPGFHEEWFSEASQDVLARLVQAVRDLPGLIIEIGAWEGRSTVALANAARPRIIQSVDTWEGSGHEISEKLAAERDVYAQWLLNVEAYTKGNVVGHRMGWREYVPTIAEPVALAFIDAEHTRIEVADNIAALIPLMAPGGIICGDDVHHEPVREGIADVLPVDRVYAQASVWIWQMPVDPDEADAVRLRAAHPDLAPTDPEWRADLDHVLPIWRNYVETVSELDMAASLPTCAYLRHICSKRKPARILDLGSGISSAILRAAGAEVVSVDDDHRWLDKTRTFLQGWELDQANLVLLNDVKEFDRANPGLYDLVFHDLAGGALREQSADYACQMVAPGGVIVFDDAHRHADAYRAAAEANGIRTWSLRVRTADAIQRWAMLGVKEGTPTAPRIDEPSRLARMYAERCQTPSDIVNHLPRFVEIVKALDAKHVIELGTRTGVSTVAWLHALEQTGGYLTSVDLDERPPIGEFDHWCFIKGSDLDPHVLVQLDPAEVVFIDTSHHLWQTRAELAVYQHLVKPGGVLVLHDTELPMPEGYSGRPYPVKTAVEEFVAEHHLEWHNYEDCWGLAVIKIGA